MGRGKETAVYGDFLRVIKSYGRRHFSFMVFRYKFFVLVLLCMLAVWACLGETTETQNHYPAHLIDDSKARDYPDFEELKDELPAPGASTRTGKDRNIQETIHNKLNKHKKVKDELESSLDFLKVPSVHPVPPTDYNKTISEHEKHKKPSERSKLNTVNGVVISNQDPEDFAWDVVGGADIFSNARHHLGGSNSLRLGGSNSLEIDDEFSPEFAHQEPGAGENGEPVHLFGQEKFRGEEIMKTEAFNLVASDKIVYTRQIPDTRDPRCQDLVYDRTLPTASIIIIFTNEAWSPLIRTIYSVLNRSPSEFVYEIILVDDYSDKKHLGKKLERFIRKYFPSKVKLLRLKSREGLIRARLTGARAAKGDVLIFLDSHCEANTGWLEPMLARIKENPLAFVVPIIDVIDDKTMEYYHGNGNYFQVGGFTWGGHFNWIDISDSEIARRGSPVAPTRSPTMAGGLFAVDRQTFWDLGSYDEEMDVWGGENLEMSFRIWQCGAVLETIPCSRVGHIFRSFHPYTFPGNKDTHGINTARTVEVWMDQYKKLFYMNRPDLLNTEIGNVKKRLQFREERQCKSFDWYLDNIYPQKFILDNPSHVFAYGRLRNPNYDTCLDNLQNEDKDPYELGQYVCHNFMAAAQFFSYSRDFAIRREDFCAQVTAVFPSTRESVTMAQCKKGEGSQQWAHTKEGKIIHKYTRKCLDGGSGQSMETLSVAPCQNIPSQIWYFDHYFK
jgi:polypeptide N-acetylgalactosaminyltransferase